MNPIPMDKTFYMPRVHGAGLTWNMLDHALDLLTQGYHVMVFMANPRQVDYGLASTRILADKRGWLYELKLANREIRIAVPDGKGGHLAGIITFRHPDHGMLDFYTALPASPMSRVLFDHDTGVTQKQHDAWRVWLQHYVKGEFANG